MSVQLSKYPLKLGQCCITRLDVPTGEMSTCLNIATKFAKHSVCLDINMDIDVDRLDNNKRIKGVDIIGL